MYLNRFLAPQHNQVRSLIPSSEFHPGELPESLALPGRQVLAFGSSWGSNSCAPGVVMLAFLNSLLHFLLPGTTFSFFTCISDLLVYCILLFWFNILYNFTILFLLTD